MGLIHFIEVAFSLGLFINAMLFVAQFIKLLKIKDSRELSFITFIGFWFIQGTTVLHGILHNDPILTYGVLLSMITCGAVIWLMIYYRFKK